MKNLYQINYNTCDNKGHEEIRYIIVRADSMLQALKLVEHDYQSQYDHALYGNVAVGLELMNSETGNTIFSWENFHIREFIEIGPDVIPRTWYSFETCQTYEGQWHNVLVPQSELMDESRYEYYDKENRPEGITIYECAADDYELIEAGTMKDYLDGLAAIYSDDDGEQQREHDDWDREYERAYWLQEAGLE